VIAHVGALPAQELLTALAGGASGWAAFRMLLAQWRAKLRR